MLGEEPLFDEFRVDWPVCADYYSGPVAKILGGQIEDSLLGGGVLIRHASVRRSVIRRQVLIVLKHWFTQAPVDVNDYLDNQNRSHQNNQNDCA